MTISTQDTEVFFTPDGVTDTYMVTFPVTDPTDVIALVAGVETLVAVTPNADQTTNPGAEVVFGAPPDLSLTPDIRLYRDTPRTQTAAFPFRGAFPAQVAEGAFDKLTRVVQELSTEVARKLGVAPGSTTTEAPALPAPETGKVLSWGVGGILVNVDLPSGGGGGGSGGYTLLTAPVTLTVGPTGDYLNLNAAFDDLTNIRPASNDPTIIVTLEIQTGVVIAEQLEFSGSRFGWVQITSEANAEVTVDTSGFLFGPRPGLGTIVAGNPAFIRVSHGGVGPTIRALFVSNQAAPTDVGLDVCGVWVDSASSILVAGLGDFPGVPVALYAGFKAFDINVAAENGGTAIVGYGATFALATTHNIRAASGGKVLGSFAVVYTAGDYSIDAKGNGTVVEIGKLGHVVDYPVGGADTDNGIAFARDGARISLDDPSDAFMRASAACSVPLLYADLSGVVSVHRVDFPLVDQEIINDGSADAVYATRGGEVRITDVTISGTTGPANDIKVEAGGFVYAHGATIPAGANVALNTITTAGAVYA